MGNRIRYIISIALLAISVFFLPCQPLYSIASLLVILYLNNIVDDYVFYYLSGKITVKGLRAFLCSPVNGVVTCVEYCVPLMAHIMKCDYVTKEVLLELKKHKSRKRYNHITVFLNKFNKHIVTNIGSPVKAIRQYNPKTEKYCMVEEGLVPKKNGKFLTNPFVRFDYENGVVCVFTLDKYVSEIVLNENHAAYGVDMFICRGSQCDMYIPADFDFIPRYGEVVKNYDRISFMRCQSTEINPNAVEKDALTLINASGITARKILAQNIYKTLGVFKNTSIPYLLCLYVGCIVGHPLEVIVTFLFVFCLHRFYKNYLYADINVNGLSRPSKAYIYIEKARNFLINI